MSCKPYQYVKVLIAEGSFSRAARHLGVSQPYLSQFVIRLEKELGLPLINRLSKPLQLTEAGQCWLDYEAKVQAVRSECREQLRNFSEGISGSVKVGLTSYWESCFLPAVLPEFQKQHPRVKVLIEEGSDDELLHKVELGAVDFALIANANIPAGFDSEILYQEHVLLAAHPSHPICAQASGEGEFPEIALEALDGQQLILASNGKGIRQWQNLLFERHAIRPEVTHETRVLSVALLLASANMGLAFTTERLARLSASTGLKMRFFSLAGFHGFNVFAVRQKDHYLSPTAMALLRIMKEQAERLAATS